MRQLIFALSFSFALTFPAFAAENERAPATCDDLDREISSGRNLRALIEGGIGPIKDATADLSHATTCKFLSEKSSDLSGLIGLNTYCETRNVLESRTTNQVIYRRLGATLKRVGNDLGDLMKERRCDAGAGL